MDPPPGLLLRRMGQAPWFLAAMSCSCSTQLPSCSQMCLSAASALPALTQPWQCPHDLAMPPRVFGGCPRSPHLQRGFPKGAGKGAGVKFKHCWSVSCCFPTRIVAVSCTVLSGAGKPVLSNSLAPCVCHVLICKTGVGARERNQPGLSQGNGTRTEGAKGF